MERASKEYEIQEEVLKIFQGHESTKLSKKEQEQILIYKGLVINSMEGLLAKIFAEIHSFYKDKWRQVCKDYLEQYPSESPIYSKLCEKFPDFIASDFFKEHYGSNNYFAELAKYKYLDLMVYNAKEKAPLGNGFIQNYNCYLSKFNIPLVINYLNSDMEINKEDDFEEERNHIFIYRTGVENKTLIVKQMTMDFIKELALDKPLAMIKELFLEKYQNQYSKEQLSEEIDKLVNYLKNMKILLT